jgi:hypothetical protein
MSKQFKILLLALQITVTLAAGSLMVAAVAAANLI